MYYHWHKLSEKEWKRNDDPMNSALEIIKQASVAGGVCEGSGEVEHIVMDENAEYETLAFAVLQALKEWGSRLREVLVDSSCEYPSY